jgi:hypothetical protein
MNPMVEAALFQITPQDVSRCGLPFDRCRAVIIDGKLDPPLLRLLSDCLDDNGWIIADSTTGDSAVAGHSKLLLVGEEINAHLDRHLRSGGSGCAVLDGTIYLIVDGQRHPILESPAELNPALLRGRLFAIAGAWALGVGLEALQTAATAVDA